MPRDNRAFIIHRCLVRLQEQAHTAYVYGRVTDANSLMRLVGRLEAQHYHAITFEYALEHAK